MSQTDILTVELTWTDDPDLELEWDAIGYATEYTLSKSLVASLVNRNYKVTAISDYGVEEQYFSSFTEARRWCLLNEASSALPDAMLNLR